MPILSERVKVQCDRCGSEGMLVRDAGANYMPIALLRQLARERDWGVQKGTALLCPTCRKARQRTVQEESGGWPRPRP